MLRRGIPAAADGDDVLSELLGDLGIGQRDLSHAQPHGHQTQLPQQTDRAASQHSSASAAQTSRLCIAQWPALSTAPDPQPAKLGSEVMPAPAAQQDMMQDAVSAVGRQRTRDTSVAPTVSASPQPAPQCSPTTGCTAPRRPIQHRPEQREQSYAARQHDRANQQAERAPIPGGGMPESGSGADQRDATAQQADAHLRCPLTQVSHLRPDS